MINIFDVMKKINGLYDYGEVENYRDLNNLLKLKLLKLIENRLVITKKWVKFSGRVSREDFISSLLCCYPPLLKTLLLRVYKESCIIVKSGDSKALFEFVDTVPQFAEMILKMKDEDIIENEEIKSLYQIVFSGTPQYVSIMNKLKLMQLAEEFTDSDIIPIGNTPNDIWVPTRRVTSSVTLKWLKDKNRFTLTPYEYKDFPVEKEVGEVLSYPWKTFLVVLLMIDSEYKVGGFEGFSIRPTDSSNCYNLQPLDLFIFNVKGREIKLGNINNFVYEFCSENDIYLFPDTSPELNMVVFDMIDERKVDYKDGEYVLNEEFKDLIYSKDIIIKNRSRKFKGMLKDHIEKLRNTL